MEKYFKKLGRFSKVLKSLLSTKRSIFSLEKSGIAGTESEKEKEKEGDDKEEKKEDKDGKKDEEMEVRINWGGFDFTIPSG